MDQHCFQLSLYLVSYFFKECMYVYQQRPKLSSLCIICSLGQVKFSLDKYMFIMAIYLSLGKYKILPFPSFPLAHLDTSAHLLGAFVHMG